MQNNKSYNRFLQMLYICLVIAFVLTSCTKEDLSDCYAPYTVTVRAFDADHKDITTTGQVKEVKLYIFDANDQYVGIQDAKVGTTVELSYPAHESLHVVVWGNSALNNQTVPALTVGDKLSEACLTLFRKTRADLPMVESPDDLFFGSLKIAEEDRKVTPSIPITRRVSGIAITVRNLKKYTSDGNGNYSLLLRKSTDKRDFYGNPCGVDVSYAPTATFNGEEELITPIFNILSTTSDIEVDICNNNVLVETIHADTFGQPFKAVEGRVLNILIDFSAQLTVDVSVTPWGEKQIWKEF